MKLFRKYTDIVFKNKGVRNIALNVMIYLSGESHGDEMEVQCKWVPVIFEVLALFLGYILVIYSKN